MIEEKHTEHKRPIEHHQKDQNTHCGSPLSRNEKEAEREIEEIILEASRI